MDVATQLKATLHYTNSPLTQEQSTASVQMIASLIAPGNSQIDWDSITAQAPSILSPSQISLPGAVQAKLQYKQEYQDAIAVSQ
jgi:hypothetical protein